jgi:hypothetical protein
MINELAETQSRRGPEVAPSAALFMTFKRATARSKSLWQKQFRAVIE